MFFRRLTSPKYVLTASLIALVMCFIHPRASVHAQDIPEPTPSAPPSRSPDSDRQPNRQPESDREEPTDDENEEPLDVETVRRSVEIALLATVLTR